MRRLNVILLGLRTFLDNRIHYNCFRTLAQLAIRAPPLLLFVVGVWRSLILLLQLG